MTACIAHHPDDPPQAADGLLVCTRHHGWLADDLGHLLDLWPALDELAQPGPGNPGSNVPGPRTPANVDVLDLTDTRGVVHNTITGWARLLVEERRLSAAPADVPTAARLLRLHIDWVCAQPWADEAIAEVGTSTWQVRRVCGDLQQRWTVGTCAMPGPDGQDCGGALRIEVEHDQRWDADRDDYGRRSRVRIVCAACRDTWTEADLEGYMNIHDVWLPVDAAAQQLGVTRRTLDRHAAGGTVRRRRGQVSWRDAVRAVRGG